MSPTVQTLVLGFVLLAIFYALGRWVVRQWGVKRILYVFYPVWAAYCLYHMSVGVSHGYSVMSELPFLGINFGIPALAAWLLQRK